MNQTNPQSNPVLQLKPQEQSIKLKSPIILLPKSAQLMEKGRSLFQRMSIGSAKQQERFKKLSNDEMLDQIQSLQLFRRYGGPHSSCVASLIDQHRQNLQLIKKYQENEFMPFIRDFFDYLGSKLPMRPSRSAFLQKGSDRKDKEEENERLLQ